MYLLLKTDGNRLSEFFTTVIFVTTVCYGIVSQVVALSCPFHLEKVLLFDDIMLTSEYFENLENKLQRRNQVYCYSHVLYGTTGIGLNKRKHNSKGTLHGWKRTLPEVKMFLN